jgi:3-dehydroquinate synthase
LTLDQQIVSVDLGPRAYRIHIGTNTLPDVGALVAGLRPVVHAAVITDKHVEGPHAQPVADSLVRERIDVDVLVVEPGESAKSIETALALWEKLLEVGADRTTLVVAVGGGVIGDLAGWVAASYARGLDFVQVPTTLLAQVDSSVGGKVGVNLPEGKNMVGAFWQPRAVLIDTAVLSTLPQREYCSGLAEVVKYGVILDAEFFAWLEANAAGLVRRADDCLRETIARCCQLKAQVVCEDEREETGARAVLNYGHTFCHAFETLTGYQALLHGEGVSIGMLCASRLAERLGRIDASLTRRQHDLLTALGLPTQVPDLDPDEIIRVMARDKKSRYGRLRFVLPSHMGHVELVDGVDSDDVRAALVP